MARAPRKSTASGASKLPSTAFAYPSRRAYPIDTVGRARNALSQAAKSGTAGTYRHVAKAVRTRYGDQVASVGPSRGVLHRPGMRKRGGR